MILMTHMECNGQGSLIKFSKRAITLISLDFNQKQQNTQICSLLKQIHHESLKKKKKKKKKKIQQQVVCFFAYKIVCLKVQHWVTNKLAVSDIFIFLLCMYNR